MEETTLVCKSNNDAFSRAACVALETKLFEREYQGRFVFEVRTLNTKSAKARLLEKDIDKTGWVDVDVIDAELNEHTADHLAQSVVSILENNP